jgi:hypothetical protein
MIVLFVFISSKNILENKSDSKKNIQNHILDNLPSQYEPSKIILLDNIDLPLNQHGSFLILINYFYQSKNLKYLNLKES